MDYNYLEIHLLKMHHSYKFCHYDFAESVMEISVFSFFGVLDGDLSFFGVSLGVHFFKNVGDPVFILWDFHQNVRNGIMRLLRVFRSSRGPF